MVNGYMHQYDENDTIRYEYRIVIESDHARVIPLSPPEYGSLEARDFLRVALLDPSQMMPAGDYHLRTSTLPFEKEEIYHTDETTGRKIIEKSVVTEIRVPLRDTPGIEKILGKTSWNRVQ